MFWILWSFKKRCDIDDVGLWGSKVKNSNLRESCSVVLTKLGLQWFLFAFSFINVVLRDSQASAGSKKKWMRSFQVTRGH